MGHNSTVFAVYILFPLRLFDKMVLIRKEIEEQVCFLHSPEPSAWNVRPRIKDVARL